MQNLRSEYINLKRKWNIMLQQYTKQVLQWKVKFLLQFHEFVYNKLLVIVCVCWFIYAFIPMLSRLFTHSFVDLFVYLLFYSFICSAHLSIYLLIHSFTVCIDSCSHVLLLFCQLAVSLIFMIIYLLSVY